MCFTLGLKNARFSEKDSNENITSKVSEITPKEI
jgi:hypothetical protein